MNDPIDILIEKEFDLSKYLKTFDYPFTLKDEIGTYFSIINDTPCLTRNYPQVNNHELLKWIKETNLKKKNLYIRSQVSPLDKTSKVYKWFAWLRKDLVIFTNGSYLTFFYSGHLPETSMNLLFSLIEIRFKMTEFQNCVFYMDEYFNNSGKLLRLSDKFIDPAIHYNDDIKNFERKIISWIKPDDAKGIIILAGEPGNGQSTYLHYLTRILERRFLYLSKWEAPTWDIENFDFMEYKRPLLILEDANEYVNNKHIYDTSLGQIVKDLLHGKIVKKINSVPVIITLNRPLSHYPRLARSDSAYIIAKYEFKPLATEKARSLITSLGKSLEISSPTTLHDIFHC